MENQQLINYITHQLALGTPRETIIQNLKQAGWNEAFITSSLDSASNPIITTESGLSKDVSAKTNTLEDDALTSPYSNMLCIVLFISLFILTNGIFSDIKEATDTVNAMLLYQGLFAIPFLIIAFTIHSSFSDENRKRFTILSIPYFGISVWIVLALMWKIAENLLSADSALGVYVVLGMIILVLTAIIMFVQHFKKK